MTLPLAIRLNPDIIKNPEDEYRLQNRNALLWKIAGVVSAVALVAIIGIVLAGAFGLATLSTIVLIPFILTTICAHKYFEHTKLAEVEKKIAEKYREIKKDYADDLIYQEIVYRETRFVKKNQNTQVFIKNHFPGCTPDNAHSLFARYLYFRNLAEQYHNEPASIIAPEHHLTAATKAAHLLKILKDPNSNINRN